MSIQLRDNRGLHCYALTLYDLQRHITCCQKHYPHAVIREAAIRTPCESGNQHFTVPMYIDSGTGYKCPETGKGCESECSS